MATVLLRNLVKRFRDVYAVRDLTLEIRDREFLTLLGPSGCGKTTTLNMIAGLEAPTSGQIYIDDRPVTHVPASKRDIAMVFQNYALYPHMTVFRNLAFALEVRHVPKATIAAQVNEVAAMLGIGTLLDRYPRQLSGGQRQRVALGRAIVRQPKVFLLDEPLSNLDAVLRVQMRADLKLLFNRLEATVVYVTHDQAEAMTMSDRIAIFNQGMLQQVDTPLNIYLSPANQFVAAFVGSPPMNFIGVEMTAERNLSFGGVALPPPSDLNPGQYLGQRLTLGFRPEDVRLMSDSEPGGMTAGVAVVEQLGASSLIYVRLHEKLVAIQANGDDQVRPGQAVRFTLPPERMYVFDAATGQAIRTPGAKQR